MSAPSLPDQSRVLYGDDPGGAAVLSPQVSADAHAAPRGLFTGKKITLRIPGKPQPGGSKRAFIPKGWKRPIITDDNPKAADWKRTVQVFAQQAFRGVIEGPIRVQVTFILARPQGHFGKRGLLPSAPPLPHRKPDATKLWRSTEDALTGFCWRDDAQIVDQRVCKVYSVDGWTGAEIEIEEVGA
jgi:Holliday junction resolvase RusA-like endonuclease